MQEIDNYREALSPGAGAVGRVKRRAHRAYVNALPELLRQTAPATRTIFGRRASHVVFGILLFAATFADIKLCMGLSAIGIATFIAPGAWLGGPFLIIGACVAFVGALEFAFAFGVWAGRSWAWPLGIAVESASIVLSAAWVLAGAALQLQLLTGLVSFAILSALAQPHVRAALAAPVPGFSRR